MVFIEPINLNFICPICGIEKVLKIPTSTFLIDNQKSMNLFIEKGLLYDHQF
ncbi:MAG: hypothetical protein ACFE9Z_06795 [Promethearchaeota archaeon]